MLQGANQSNPITIINVNFRIEEVHASITTSHDEFDETRSSSQT